MKATRRLKCDNCADGIVKMVVKSTKRAIEFDVKDCDKCGKSFGFKSVSNLEDAEP